MTYGMGGRFPDIVTFDNIRRKSADGHSRTRLRLPRHHRPLGYYAVAISLPMHRACPLRRHRSWVTWDTVRGCVNTATAGDATGGHIKPDTSHLRRLIQQLLKLGADACDAVQSLCDGVSRIQSVG